MTSPWRAIVIVLEGSDGAGKTTVAKNLERIYSNMGHDVVMWHFGPHSPDKTSIEEYFEPLAEWWDEHGEDHHYVLIIDRFHLGEKVYGPLMRGASRMSDDEQDAIDNLLNKIYALRFYVRPKLQTILNRFDARGDDFINGAHIMDIVKQYDMLTVHTWTRIDETLQDFLATLGGHR